MVRRTNQRAWETNLSICNFGDWRGFNKNVHLLSNMDEQTVRPLIDK